MATIALPANGQTLTNIPDYIAEDDQLLRDLLSPTMPDLANATFERKTENGLLTVTVSKRAGTKGGEAKHTPGPWINEDGYIFQGDIYGKFIAGLSSANDDDDSEVLRLSEEEVMANGQLITAAHDLLAACEALEKLLLAKGDPFLGDDYDAMQSVRAAIAKAKGEA